ncbi:selenium cofactor biosynthesis protein YqeC [Helicovermis profundi]|uniref:selenium cofactor biosynthesis protein YqeC n=1 Tax=Helicovermis profundi TaxID=3065157 RepID=UPI0030CC8E39
MNIDKKVITFIGSGGKTSSIFLLANKLKKMGKTVLIATTTKMYKETNEEYKTILTNKIEKVANSLNNKIIILGSKIDSKKLIGVDKEFIDHIKNENIFDFILVEGDGSRKKTIKAHGEEEPVIPSLTDLVVGVFSIDSLNRPINDNYVYRSEKFLDIVEKNMNEEIELIDYVKYVNSSNGLFKGCTFFNKALLITKVNNKDRINNIVLLEKFLKNTNSLTDFKIYSRG